MKNLLSCWRGFRKGKAKKSDVMEFERHLEDNIFQLHYELLLGSYRHGPYSTFHIYDPKHRVISKALVRDRLVHHVVFNELYRIFDPTFIFHSYSSRLGKGTHVAVRNVANCLRQASHNYARTVYILKCDIKKFFWSVDHQKLLAIIQTKITDEKLLSLIHKIIGGFPPENKTVPKFFFSIKQ
ncbi:MAG: reverse transcriptase domain-containing protein, partial [Patescibacteria group bacterium]